MKKMLKPEIEFIKFGKDDVITTSWPWFFFDPETGELLPEFQDEGESGEYTDIEFN